MGVADMTSTWGGGMPPVPDLPARAERWATPKRCCSSATMRASLRKATPWEMRAWVPTARSISPAARACRIRFFSAAGREPVSSPTRTPAGERRADRER